MRSAQRLDAHGPVRFAARGVAFDLDGTLLDTLGDLTSAANGWLDEEGERTLSTNLIGSFVGKGIRNLVRRALAASRGVPEESLSDREIDDSLHRYERHYLRVLGSQTVLFPGVREGLDRIAAMDLPLAIVTNKSSRFVQLHLQHANIGEYFDVVRGGEDLATRKPHPGPLLHVCDAFGIPPADLLMVGDSENDVQAARRAGCPVVVMPYGYRGDSAVDALQADAVLPSIVDVADCLAPSRA
jgi:phosphoglycolate phosphatase